jgi:hypothetical protein
MNALQKHLQKAGRVGGASTSRKKRAAGRKNLTKARRALAVKRAKRARAGKGGTHDG